MSIHYVNGKRYNTETSKLIAEWDNGHYITDFHHCEETLYKTKKGAWFVVGTGGALSSYSQSVGSDGYSGGSGVRVLTPEEALEWVEGKDLSREEEIMEEHFSDLLEDA
tara:strand:+ start:1772 stop:2098 length:327 start_codon:yes stop_codon:yes gene_type:complete